MWKVLVVLSVTAGTPPQFGLGTGDSAQPAPPRPRPRPRPQPKPQPAPQPELSCTATRPPDRSCTSDSDCTLVRTVTSCCGTLAILGINRADLARFEDQDRRCNRGRACGCAPGPSSLDSGERVRGNELVSVSCQQSQCTSALSAVQKLTSENVDELPTCAVEQCGPAPMYPNWRCPDGVHQGGRGPCVRLNGRCGWARLECP